MDSAGLPLTVQFSREPPPRKMSEGVAWKDRIEEVKGRYSFADPLTVAVLAALNIADDIF